MPEAARQPHRVVIVGGGFGGLYAARALRKAPVQVTLIDRHNYHLFQPLLYQVATGALSPANIAAPLRSVLSHQRNATVLLGEVVDIHPQERMVSLSDGQQVSYDTLLIAAGMANSYFGHSDWEQHAPSLKTLSDATELRRRVLTAFEHAERDADWQAIRQQLTFVVVGGGPTGVELAGALAEISRDTLRRDFRRIRPADARLLLVEGGANLLDAYEAALQDFARRKLERLGVQVWLNSRVIEVSEDHVLIRREYEELRVPTQTVLWAAGVKANPLSKRLAERTACQLDRIGRVIVQPDLTVHQHPEILVIGDMAHSVQDGQPLPGVAQVAMQQGRYAVRLVEARLRGETLPPFHYRDLGSMATIGRAAAVCQIGGRQISGLPGWLLWLFVHLMYIVQHENRLLVLFQWAFNYFTRNRAARLITDEVWRPATPGVPAASKDAS